MNLEHALALVHVASCAACLAFGTAVVLAPKGTPWHRRHGIAYAVAMIVLNASALGVYRLTGHFNLFHGFALFGLATVGLGWWAGRHARRSPQAREAHARTMAWSYAGLWMAAISELAVRVPVVHQTLGFGPGVAVATGLVAAVSAWMIEHRVRRLRRG